MSVVAFKRPGKKSDLEVVESDNWQDLIVSELQKKIRGGTRIYTIAQSTGLNSATISKLISEETRFPRMHTVLVILKYLGFKIYAQRN